MVQIFYIDDLDNKESIIRWNKFYKSIDKNLFKTAEFRFIDKSDVIARQLMSHVESPIYPCLVYTQTSRIQKIISRKIKDVNDIKKFVDYYLINGLK